MKNLILLVILVLHSFVIFAQPNNKLKLKLDEKGDTFIKAYINTQFWARYTDMNPGSTINDEEVSSLFDVSMRRLRLGVSAKLTPKLFVVAQFGGNNINYKSDKTFQFKVLDLYAQYAFNDALIIGMGKSGHQGLSRIDSRSYKSLLSLDAPIFCLSTDGTIDDMARYIGVFVKGQVGKLDYRMAFQSPENYYAETPTIDANYAKKKQDIKLSGYLKYQFFDKESTDGAYHTSTYLGTKRVFNIGLGFTQLADATYTSASNGVLDDTKYHNLKHWSADIFYDVPLNTSNNQALTSYISYSEYDFGPNYIRNMAANNPATGSNENATFNGSGNAFPMVGTGSNVFFQAGYLLSNKLLGKKHGQLQPNISIQYSDLEKLDDPVLVFDYGVNWYFNGHSSKLSLGFQNRPIFGYEGTELNEIDRKNLVVLQYQICIN